jgi:hypothetical protein
MAPQDNNRNRITHNNFTTKCQTPEARHTRGTQQGLLAILVLLEAPNHIDIQVDTIHLYTATKKSLYWNRYHTPRQGFNCLAKASSDLSKEIQTKYKNTNYKFTYDNKNMDDTEQESTQQPDAPPTHQQTNRNIITPAPPSSKYQLKIDGTTYNYLPEALLNRRRTLPPFKKLLASHCSLPEKQFDNITWSQIERAITSVNLSLMLPIVKFTSNKWATGDRMEKHYGEPSNCPFCGSHEDTAHVFS